MHCPLGRGREIATINAVARGREGREGEQMRDRHHGDESAIPRDAADRLRTVREYGSKGAESEEVTEGSARCEHRPRATLSVAPTYSAIGVGVALRWVRSLGEVIGL